MDTVVASGDSAADFVDSVSDSWLYVSAGLPAGNAGDGTDASNGKKCEM